jgi:hypothetical protein
MSLLRHQSRVWIDYATDIVSPSRTLAFGMKISEKCKSTSPGVVQVKNQQKTDNIEE